MLFLKVQLWTIKKTYVKVANYHFRKISQTLENVGFKNLKSKKIPP